jgi:hypothetical protein
VTEFQWATLILGMAGFLVTWTVHTIAITNAVKNIKADAAKNIIEETDKIGAKLTIMADKFSEDQKVQDHNFGEVGAAMRQYIADVEKKVREVEIWGRDNYAMKDDVRDILKDIKDMRADIKSDIRDLTKKIEQADDSLPPLDHPTICRRPEVSYPVRPGDAHLLSLHHRLTR